MEQQSFNQRHTRAAAHKESGVREFHERAEEDFVRRKGRT